MGLKYEPCAREPPPATVAAPAGDRTPWERWGRACRGQPSPSTPPTPLSPLDSSSSANNRPLELVLENCPASPATPGSIATRRNFAACLRTFLSSSISAWARARSRAAQAALLRAPPAPAAAPAGGRTPWERWGTAWLAPSAALWLPELV